MDLRIENLVDVPKDWDFCAEDIKAYENLKASIRKEGLRQPVIVWAREDEEGNETFMVLDGRRRVRAYRDLLAEERKKDWNRNERRYSHIPACIYEEDELTEEQARKLFTLTKLYGSRELISGQPTEAVIAMLDQMGNELGRR